MAGLQELQTTQLQATTQAKSPLSDWRTGSDESLQSSGGTMLQGLAFCLGVFLIGTYICKRLGSKNGTFRQQRRLKVLERTPLASKTSLLLIEVDGKEVLLAVGADKVTQIQTAKETVHEFSEKDFEESYKVVCNEQDALKLSA